MWTDEQLKALETLKKNTIVSAGAGSGKTAVLTTRVFNILKNGLANLDEIIVLTFTNAAAQEMRDRIRSNLVSAGLNSLANSIEAANITTFDAYALTLVKKYHYIFNLGDNIKIIDDSIVKVEEQRIINGVFEEFYNAGDEQFNTMIKQYCVKSDRVLKDFVKDILSFKDLLIDENDLFLHYKKIYLTEEVFNKYVKEVCGIIHKTYEEAIGQLNFLEDLKVVESMKETFDTVFLSDDYDDIYTAILSMKFQTMRELEENDKALRDLIKKNIQQFNKKVISLGDYQTMKERFFNQDSIKAVDKLIEITKSVDKLLKEYKFSFASFTFSDIAKMALELVKREDIQKEIKAKIKFIMIDEYQDTSDIQDAFISYISNDNVYMVGDTKQSIYRFRNANCELFQNKYDDYKDEKNGVKIDLTKNFRSRKEILNDVNNIYSKLMSPVYGGVNYKNDHIIKFGNSDYEEYGNSPQKYQIEVYDYKLDGKKNEKEAQIIANDIITKINSGYLVYDKTDKKLRKCTFQDFAILDASKNSFDIYQKVFDNASIPLKTYKEELVASSQVGYFVFNLVNVLFAIKNQNYSLDFVHSFIALVRSFVFRYSDQKIHDIVTKKQILEDEVFIGVSSIYEQYKNEPINILIDVCLKRFNVYLKLLEIGNIDGNLSNLENLLNKIKDVAMLGYNIDGLYDYFKEIKTMKLEIKNENNENLGNVVKMMTIHKSKGLEFPIVYLPSLDHKFNLADTKLTFSKSIKYGLIMPLIDCDIDESVSIVRFLAREKEIEESISEKIRVLYVAMTRAKEKIILIQNDDSCKNTVFLSKASSFQDFLSYLYQNDVNLMTTYIKKDDSLKLIDKNDERIDINIEFFNEAKFPEVQLTSHRASKVVREKDEEVLAKGNYLHRLMELVDFKTLDYSFIKEEDIKEKIARVLELPIFKSARDGIVYKEYAYCDEDNQVGIIDLMVVYDDYIAIIDYKMWDIEDEHYVEQLLTYGSFVNKKFSKPVKLYICSLLKAYYKEIPFIK